MNAFIQSLRSLGPARLMAMAAVSVGLLGFIIYFTMRMGSPKMELLYSDLDTGAARAITQQLDARQIPYQLRADGRDIYVPGDQMLKMRLETAEVAHNSGIVNGYELFDKMDALGATNFMQNVNLVRALEGELARTIMSVGTVKQARVHLVLPKREMFSRETQEPSASVILRVQGGRLSKEQISAIQYLVASAVPKLKPSRISIVDDKGQLLARGFEDDKQVMISTQEEMRQAQERRLSQNVEDLLARTIGPGKVRAQVSVEMDFDRVVTNAETYDPDGQVVRSTVTENEAARTDEQQNDSVTVQQNMPDPNLNNNQGRATSSNQRTVETTNYEITKKVANSVRENGVIKRLSIAVLVDGVQVAAADGTKTYQDRSPEEMDKIATLVRSAVGYDAQRGDQVDVINMRFQTLDDALGPADETLFLGFTKAEIMRMAEGLGVAVVAILVILLIVRPLVTRAFESLPTPSEQASRQLLTEATTPQLAAPAGAMVPSDDEDLETEELIDIDKVEGRVRASSLRKIGEIVQKHPEEALSIVRNWMYQET
ncbi:Flagellar M-ring protein FliF [uncultured Alphaproteobacteria bacterium]|uniref:Flagellar M-ring protein n=1 Tax=uncultured Alphaproteobacteria bacterium TaxID=91750 RepID=A0A212JQ56_9PROT|nr:Flagellar M-ring protein FliF [uncultured Alphaproteobacteria bacterium]